MKRLLLTGSLLVLAAAPVAAHHSAAMFDRTRVVTLNGTVKGFQWTNPHSWLQLTTADGKDWSIEMTSPNLLARTGWKPTTLKPGDKITVIASPLRDGGAGGQFRSATLADGRQLTNEGVVGAP